MNFLRRVLLFLFSWKTAGRLLFAAACLATLAALLVIEENWRGKRDWERFARAHETRGESLDLKAYIPPAVPDDQNFAMTPLLAPIFPDEKIPDRPYTRNLEAKLQLPDVNGKTPPGFGSRAKGRYTDIDAWKDYLGADVLEWLKKYDPELREISEASRRPYSRFPLTYTYGLGMNFLHIKTLIELARLYTLRACVELHEEKTDATLADAETIFRLAESVKDEPFILSQSVRTFLWQFGVQVVWEGLDEHRWTDAQLQTLQAELARTDLLKGLVLAFHGELAAFNGMMLGAVAKPEILAEFMGKTFRFYPRGLIYRNLLEINRFYEKYPFASVNPAARRIYPVVLKEGDQSVADVKPYLYFYKILEIISLPVFESAASKVAYEQSTIDQALIACALERYRLANGQFPDALAKLVPTYLKAIPSDVVDGKPPHYRLNNDGTFFLYSDGWDGKDHGGKLMMKSDNSGVDIMKGDWVWSGKAE